MKRPILMLAAALLVGGAIPEGAALAKGGHGDGRRDGGWEQVGDGGGRGNRGGEWRNDNRGPGRNNGNGRWSRPAPYEPAPMPMPPRNMRRGGYLPPEAQAPVIEDHARYRLRTPPRGFTWVRVPGGYALVNEMSGQIFDMVPVR